jgi:hypothetical protein
VGEENAFTDKGENAMRQFSGRGLFPLGRTLATPGALEALDRTGDSLEDLFVRHQQGDWVETGPEDAQTNEDALLSGGRIFSVYHLRDQAKLWVITEADRAATNALLPNEY